MIGDAIQAAPGQEPSGAALTEEVAADDERVMPPSGPWSRPYRRATAGLLLTIASGAFEALAVATVMPATVDDLGGLRYYGWAFSAFLLSNLVGIVVAGDEADRRGPAAPFLAGVLLFSGGLLVGGLAPSMIVLILGRAIQGFGGGLIYSVAYVVVGRGYPEEGRPRMLALMSTAWVVPGLIGPAVAGLVAGHIGWRWVYLGLAPMPPLAALLAMPAVRRIPGGSSSARDWRRLRHAVQLAVGMALLLMGLGQSRWPLAVALVAVGAAVAWTALQTLLPPGTLRARSGLPAAIATMGLLNLAFFGVDPFVPLALTDVRQTSTAFAGLALTAGTITWTIGSWLQAHYARRSSPRRLIRIGLSIIAVGIVATIGVVVTDVTILAGPLAWGIAGLGIGIAYSTLSLVVLESAPAGQEGSATSSMQLTNSLGIAMATGTGGVLIAALSTGDTATRAGIGWQFFLMIGVLALALVTAGRLPRRLSGTDDEAGRQTDEVHCPEPALTNA
jgi:MFS family permease